MKWFQNPSDAEELNAQYNALLEGPEFQKENNEAVQEEIRQEYEAMLAQMTEESRNVQQEAPAAEEMTESPKAQPSAVNRALLVAVIVLLIAVIVLLGKMIYDGSQKKTETAPTEAAVETAETTEATIPADGNPDDVTCKGTYTADDAAVLAAHDTVVATCGDAELTNGQLQIYYWSQVGSFLNYYGQYLSYFGMDAAQGLDTQVCTVVENQTWQQFFLQSALEYWQNYSVMGAKGKEEKVEMHEEFVQMLDRTEQELEDAAKAAGFDDADGMLQHDMGASVNLADYKEYVRVQYEGFNYFDTWQEKNTPGQQELDDYFTEHAQEYADNGVTKDTVTVDVRHILIMPEDTESEDSWKQAETQAQDLLKQWQTGAKTEDSFAALATEHTQDPGSKSNGGLYTGVTVGQMVQAFNDWCFDAARKTGDTGVVKTEYGYHVMYFVGSQSVWEGYASTDLMKERETAMMDALKEASPLKVDYSKILLGEVNLAG